MTDDHRDEPTDDQGHDRGPDPDAPLDPNQPDLDLDVPVPASPAETTPDTPENEDADTDAPEPPD